MAKCLSNYSILFRRPRTIIANTGLLVEKNPVVEGLSYRRHVEINSNACQFRQFSSSQHWKNSHDKRKDHEEGKGSFGSRLRVALRNTKVKWYPIPASLGICVVGLIQVYRLQRAEKERELREAENESSGNGRSRCPRVRPSGPWHVQIMSTLPLKAISRLWGSANRIEIPYYLRVPGFRLYSWLFGVKLDEVAEPDLHTYPNLAAFFYRQLKPGVRPLDPNLNAVLSPSDGRILQFGTIERGEVEQVKGMTYSLDALLGAATPASADHQRKLRDPREELTKEDEAVMMADKEFAQVNNISYTLPSLLSGDSDAKHIGDASFDASTMSEKKSESEVKADLARGDDTPWYAPKSTPSHALYYAVIYLAPGDYHRFHSPVPWVVESRRHFAGELYSVSPYLQRHLPGLFTLNERVALLGRWRWGFFSYTPVGATNVGSIKINFDSELRTNSFITDTAADMAAEMAAQRGEPYHGFIEATYHHASRTLGGHALDRGEEMGGFQLGSSIVLVFEAPMGVRKSFDLGWNGGERKGGWRWSIHPGQSIKVGQKLGYVDEE